jgi:hypothetical protein
MDPITIIALADAALVLINKAIPAIRDAFASGEIPVEKQAEVRAKYEALRAAGGAAFQGPEYELSGR